MEAYLCPQVYIMNIYLQPTGQYMLKELYLFKEIDMSFYMGSNYIDVTNTNIIESINTDMEDQFILKTISQYTNSVITNIGSRAFAYCNNLTSVNLPEVTTISPNAFRESPQLISVICPKVTNIGQYAFFECYNLSTIDFPICSQIGSHAFRICRNITNVNLPIINFIDNQVFGYCSNLTTISLPMCNSIGSSAFTRCESLTSVNFSNCTMISQYAFQSCFNLLSVYLLGSSVPTLSDVNAFSSTPISDYTVSTSGVYGSIYVPASLYNDYLTATNWSVYSSRFVSV